jgi:hypothetical protein
MTERQWTPSGLDSSTTYLLHTSLEVGKGAVVAILTDIPRAGYRRTLRHTNLDESPSFAARSLPGRELIQQSSLQPLSQRG